MNDCISREYIINKIKEHRELYTTYWGDFSSMPLADKVACDVYAACYADVVNAPAVDVQPVNQWISVNDRLPEAVEKDVNGKIAFSDFVLVYLVYDDGFTFITVDKCNTDKKRWLHEIPSEGCKVTHWQPLPEPPKEG